MAQDNKLYLHPHDGIPFDMPKDQISYFLGTEDPDSYEVEGFDPVMEDVMVELLRGYVPMIRVHYYMKRKSQKRLLLKDRPAVFEEGAAGNWLFYLRQSGWDGGFYFVREYKVKNKNAWHPDHKELCLVQSRIDRKLLRKMHAEPEGTGEVVVNGYLPLAPFPEAVTEENYRRYLEEPIAISFMLDRVTTRMYVSFSPSLYPEERLLERIRTALARHGRTLED